MDDRRPKNQLVLAFMEEDRGEAPKGRQEGTETSGGKRGIESPAITEQLMEEVCERENCKRALKRVKANKGSPGVDGMTVRHLPTYSRLVPSTPSGIARRSILLEEALACLHGNKAEASARTRLRRVLCISGPR